MLKKISQVLILSVALSGFACSDVGSAFGARDGKKSADDPGIGSVPASTAPPTAESLNDIPCITYKSGEDLASNAHYLEMVRILTTQPTSDQAKKIKAAAEQGLITCK